MSYPKIFFTLLSILTLIGTMSGFSPIMAASDPAFSLQQGDIDRIDAYIQSRMQIANIPGLALGVVNSDGVVYLKGYGVAGTDGRAVSPQTLFILGSTSKSFTALAVMQLVEAGRINLDAPVTTYLPWFRTNDAAASAQITVRHLLNQTSGLPAYSGRRSIVDNDQSSTALENGVRELASVQLNQPAGQRYEYANDNYNLLGMIVQAVSGRSYEDYIRSAIFAPLQMSHSAAALSDPAAIDLAAGYRSWFFWSVAFDAPYPRRMTPSGFLISSAEDMTHYLIAQLNGGAYGNNRVLSPQGIDTLHTPSPTSSYGMGWIIQGQPGSTRIWHIGDVSNFHSNILLLPDQHIGIVVLVNLGGFLNVDALNIPIEGVAEILLGNNLTARTNPPLSVIPQVTLLAALLIPALWIAASYLSIRRWQQRGKLPPRSIERFWRFYLPLAVDMLPVGIVWLLLPSLFHAPMETIALFAPDVFLVITTLTLLCVGWAMARVVLTLHPRHVVNYSGSRKQTKSHWLISEDSLG